MSLPCPLATYHDLELKVASCSELATPNVRTNGLTYASALPELDTVVALDCPSIMNTSPATTFLARRTRNSWFALFRSDSSTSYWASSAAMVVLNENGATPPE